MIAQRASSPKRSKPIPRVRATPRTHKCSACSARISTVVCQNCGTRKSTRRGSIGSRCDTLWAQIIKAPGKCFRCGTTEGLQAAHIIGRAQRVVRWDTTNGICLCFKDHRAFDAYRISREVLITNAIGLRAYERLIKKAQGVWDKQYPLAELSARLKEVKK